MTQRRRIAISYLFAVPAVLAIVLVQHLALLRVKNAEAEMAGTAETLRQSEMTASPEPAESAGQKRGGGQERTAAQSAGPNLVSQTKLVAEARAALGTRLGSQKEIADGTVRFAETVNTFSGVLAIWLVGVAAFLLFHDERARAWTGVERRVHTRIIETMPLGVCLSTVGGGILYANAAEDVIFGYEREGLIGKDVTRLHGPVPADPNLTVGATIDRLEPGQTWSGEVAINRKDGATLRTQAWIMNMEVAGKLYRLFVHNPAN